MGDEDYELALKLQQKFDRELHSVHNNKVSAAKDEIKEKWKHRQRDLNSTQNIVHPEWESLDPTPDVHALFSAFDDKFFQSRLKCVALEWSKRMYSCAGICYSRKNRMGMAITIRLSEPLLKLRSRKDLIETLLHEMIHAYCFVLGIREGNGGHGPNFKKIMNGINKVAGTNITVYHSFHDEVNIYKTHWWRCNGICQHRKPFFGYVKRTCNRAPGPNDVWWRQHLNSCGGSFLKIQGPEEKKLKSENEDRKAVVPMKDIRSFFGNENKENRKSKGLVKGSGDGTIVINDSGQDDSHQHLSSTTKKGFQSGGSNIIGFEDLNDTQHPKNAQRIVPIDLTGPGYSLKNLTTDHGTPSTSQGSREHVRSVWASKFQANDMKRSNEKTDSNEACHDSAGDEKRRKIDVETVEIKESINIFKTDSVWTEIDDEIMFKEDTRTVIDISSDEDNSESDSNCEIVPTVNSKSHSPKLSTEDRQRQIKQEILDTSDCLLSEDDIEILDDDYNDSIVTANVELADTSLIDDLFGEDTLMRDFKQQNAVVAYNSRYHSDPKNDIISCPVCHDKVAREFFSDHLDGCVGISIKVAPPRFKGKVVPYYKRKDKCPPSATMPDAVKLALKNAGYDSKLIAEIVKDDMGSSSQEESTNRRRGLDTSTHACPVCGHEVDVDRINEHLDICLPDD